MDESELSKLKLEKELQWVKYRQKMLDIMEEKLLKMREIVEQAKQGNYTVEELEILNERLNNLASQVRARDSKSRKIEYEVMDE